MKMNIFAHEPRKSSICWILSMPGTVNEGLGEIICVVFTTIMGGGYVFSERPFMYLCSHNN